MKLKTVGFCLFSLGMSGGVWADNLNSTQPDCAVGYKQASIVVSSADGKVVCADSNVSIPIYQNYNCPSYRPVIQCPLNDQDPQSNFLMVASAVIQKNGENEYYANSGLQNSSNELLTWGSRATVEKVPVAGSQVRLSSTLDYEASIFITDVQIKE